MNILIPITLLSIYLCYTYQHKPKVVQLVFAQTMLIGFLLAAFRYEFGPDYFNYRNLYEYITQFGIDSYVFYSNHAEMLFLRYMILFPNYTLFLAFNSLLWFYLYYRFFSKYADRHYLWFVVFMLFFNVNCILNNLVAMRQAIGSYLFILAFYALVQQKKAWYVLIIAICTMMHMASIVLFPLIFITNDRKSIFFRNTYIYTVFALATASIFVGKNLYLSIFATILTDSIRDLERYTTYIENMGERSFDLISLIKYVVLLALNFIPLQFIIQQARKETDGEYILIYKLGIIISTLGVIFGGGMISRFMMILNPFYIISLIRSFSATKSGHRKIIVITATMFVTLYSLYNYLSEDYSVTFLTYHSIFEAPVIP